MIMFGQPGTLNLIQKGEYPPLTKKQQREMEEEEDVDNWCGDVSDVVIFTYYSGV